MIKTHAGRLLYKYIPLTFLQGFEKVVWGFTVRGSWRPNINCNILTPNLWPSRCVFLVLLMLNQSPGVHSAGCWLSLLHLISIFSGPQFIMAPSPFGLVWLSLPHFTPLELQLSATQLAAQPEAQGPLCWVIGDILSATSLVPKLHRGSRGPPRPGVAFPTTSRLTTATGLTSVLTELYNSSTPTRSLKSNV